MKGSAQKSASISKTNPYCWWFWWTGQFAWKISGYHYDDDDLHDGSPLTQHTWMTKAMTLMMKIVSCTGIWRWHIPTPIITTYSYLVGIRRVGICWVTLEERLRDYVSSQDWYESEQGVISSVHLPLPMLSLWDLAMQTTRRMNHPKLSWFILRVVCSLHA